MKRTEMQRNDLKLIKWAVIIGVTILLALLATSAFAQDSAEPTTPPEILPDVDYDLTFENLQAYLLAMIVAFSSSPISTLVVSTLKRLPALKAVDGKTLQTIVGVVLFLALFAAKWFGIEAQFRQLLDIIYQGIPILLTLITFLTGSGVAYSLARRYKVAWLGYSRSPESPTVASR